jgi:hypothetical protein
VTVGCNRAPIASANAATQQTAYTAARGGMGGILLDGSYSFDPDGPDDGECVVLALCTYLPFTSHPLCSYQHFMGGCWHKRPVLAWIASLFYSTAASRSTSVAKDRRTADGESEFALGARCSTLYSTPCQCWHSCGCWRRSKLVGLYRSGERFTPSVDARGHPNHDPNERFSGLRRRRVLVVEV